MGFIGAIIVGGIAGWLAEKIMGSEMGIFANIGLGILGAIVGFWIAGLVGLAASGFVARILVATGGAVLLIWLARMVRGRA